MRVALTLEQCWHAVPGGTAVAAIERGFPLTLVTHAFVTRVLFAEERAADGEVIALAWVVYRNKEERDRISKAVMEDPQLKDSMDPSKMPFDGKRMFWGGFETITELAGGR